MSKLLFSQKGLTLVETTVALGILMIGVMASLILLISTFNFAERSEQEIVVVNLAREGIEAVRTLRNNNAVDLFSGGYDGKNFIIDVDENFNLDSEVGTSAIQECDQCILYLNNDRYLHNAAGAATNFRRMITIEDVSVSEKKVLSKVYWTLKGNSYEFLLETNLTDWTDELKNIKLFNNEE